VIHQVDIYGQDKVQKAIEIIRFFEPSDGSGYWLAFSGGKDSVVVKALMDMAGVKYESHYHVTTVDPPELIRFIKQTYPDVIFDHSFYGDGTPKTMWNLIVKKGMIPTRSKRYCCAELKEHYGAGRAVVTGVRWAESVNRAKNQGLVKIDKSKKAEKVIAGITDDYVLTDKGGIILNNDNEETREVFETCIKMRNTTLNPIIDWQDDDVWEFIREYNVPYCGLYDEGLKRLGCIGCPMGGPNGMKRDFERWPVYKQNYLKALDRLIKRMEKENPGRFRNWKTAEDIFKWWVGEE